MQLQLGLEVKHFCELFSHYEQIRFIVPGAVEAGVAASWQRAPKGVARRKGESKR